MLVLRKIAFVLLALFVGGIGLQMSGSFVVLLREAWLFPIVTGILFFVLFFFLSGLGIGFFNSRGWKISGLSAWGCILSGPISLYLAIFQPGGYAPTGGVLLQIFVSVGILLIPLSLAIYGGWVGKNLKVGSAIKSYA